MRADISSYAKDRLRDVTIKVYPKTKLWVDILGGRATGGYVLDSYITRASHTSRELTATMTWDGTGTFLANQPRAGQIVEVLEDGYQLWIGVVDTINSFTEARGNRSINMVARSRDGIGPWRTKRITTPRFQQGTTLTSVITTILTNEGLSDSEYDVPLGGKPVPHSNVQFTDTTPWAALTTIGIATGMTQFTDAVGRIKFYRRDVQKPADFVLTNELVKQITGGKGTRPITAYRLKWLNRNLTEVVQQAQQLAQTSVAAGYHKAHQNRLLYWSDDHRSRAKNTHMRIIQSMNSGLLNIGDEEYVELDRFSGEVQTTIKPEIQFVALALLAIKLGWDYIPESVYAFGWGQTIPPSKSVFESVVDGSLLLVMMSLGVGQYEIWGEPFDFVHEVNSTEAFDNAAPYWQTNPVTVSNDLIFDETHAQEVAVRELLYGSAVVNNWDTIIVDDPRIEPGDIIELPDTSRLFVMDYLRDLTRGSMSELAVSGFRS